VSAAPRCCLLDLENHCCTSHPVLQRCMHGPPQLSLSGPSIHHQLRTPPSTLEEPRYRLSLCLFSPSDVYSLVIVLPFSRPGLRVISLETGCMTVEIWTNKYTLNGITQGTNHGPKHQQSQLQDHHAARTKPKSCSQCFQHCTEDVHQRRRLLQRPCHSRHLVPCTSCTCCG
jgi:hypothetical protein